MSFLEKPQGCLQFLGSQVNEVIGQQLLTKVLIEIKIS